MTDITLGTCVVSYRRADDRADRAQTLEVALEGAGGAAHTADLRLDAHVSDETIEVTAQVCSDLVFDGCTVGLSHRFARDERLLINGYQSWTDTRERSPFDRMRGLRGVPRALVRRYALDGGGDYRFVDYPFARGRQHGFTYMTLRREVMAEPGTAGVTLVGSLDESGGFTLIDVDALAGRICVRKEVPPRTFKAGEKAVLLRLAIVTARDLDGAYDRWFELMGIQARPALPLIGYTSWYRHYDSISAEKLEHDLAGAVRMFESLGFDSAPAPGIGPAPDPDLDSSLDLDPDLAVGPDAVPRLGRLFQIDDGYAKIGDWLDVDGQKFPQGLALLARQITDAGFIPGLWVAPFVCERASRLAAEHPEWLLRGGDGGPVTTGCQWSGGLALDTLNPEVRAYIADVLCTMTRQWGFKLLKCDFLYAACMLPHGGFNRGQLMADGIDLLRKAVGPDVAILACGVPLGSAFGKVEYCRIGCDVGLDWDDKPHMRLLHRERVSTKESLANTRARAPLDGRAFLNDPDVFFLRDDVALTDARRIDLLQTDARLGSMLLTSDDMAVWGPAECEMYLEAVQTLSEG